MLSILLLLVAVEVDSVVVVQEDLNLIVQKCHLLEEMRHFLYQHLLDLTQ
tara:strand:- start:288 stop:437 length:150 start_codon:yes stop_codon:yes gene_type:complete